MFPTLPRISRKTLFALSFLALVTLASPRLGAESTGKSATDATPAQKAAHVLRGLPMAFEPNVGQAGSGVDYVARSAGYSVSLSATGAALHLERGAGPATLAEALNSREAKDLSHDFTMPGPASAQWDPVKHQLQGGSSESVLLRLVGARDKSRAVPRQRLPGKVNYLLGNDRAKWRRNLPTFAKVHYSEVYRNIDVIYYGNPQSLEFDFTVKPGGNPADIRLSIPGAARLRLNERGDLSISTGSSLVTAGDAAGDAMTLHAPTTYQLIAGRRHEVPSRFVIHKDQTVGFALGEYDHSAPLVIDPIISYSTFLGGSSTDLILGIAADGTGNIYVTGYTTSANFPTVTPISATRNGTSSDIFVSKINAAGSALVYSTYLGGTGFDHGHGIAVESNGAVTIGGDTSSSNFPLQGPIQPAYSGGGADLFLLRLNPAGSALTYSTFLGGSGNDSAGGSESFSSTISVDSAGNAFIAGATSSNNFPTVAPLQGTLGGQFDAVVAKLNPAGSALVFSTYLGGSSVDTGAAVVAGPTGDVYVTGTTNSTNFPLQAALDSSFGGGTCGTGACADAFVTRLNAAGSALVYSTYLGGASDDLANGIVVDSGGSAYVTGLTTSGDFPVANAFQSGKAASADVFVSKLNASGSALTYSTFLGGGGGDVGLGIRLDSANRAYVTGYTGSNAYPTAGATQGNRTAVLNAFLSVVGSSGSTLDFSTYIGGNTLDYGTSVDLDSARNFYVGGFTLSGNLFTANALQPAFGGGTCGTAPNTFPCEDGFIAKFTPAALPPTVTSLSPASATVGGAAFTLTVNGTGFNANSLVRVGTLTRPTTFVSSTVLTAAMPATDLANPGTLQISVFNGAPDNIASNALPFTVSAGANAPVVSQGGVVNNASFAASPAPVAPGSIAAIFGQRLTDGSSSLSSSFDANGRLATTLAGARVTVNNIAAPIFYATPGQMGIQIPVELAGQNTASLVVTVGSNASAPASINLAPSVPGIFTANQSGSGPGAITHADGSAVTAANPATPGEVVIIYMTGLGPLTPAVGTGVRAGASATTTPAIVTFNGVNGAVDYAGSAPNFVGLNQINVRIPEGVLPSNNVQVVVRIGGRDSNPVTIAVQ